MPRGGAAGVTDSRVDGVYRTVDDPSVSGVTHVPSPVSGGPSDTVTDPRGGETSLTEDVDRRRRDGKPGIWSTVPVHQASYTVSLVDVGRPTDSVPVPVGLSSGVTGVPP